MGKGKRTTCGSSAEPNPPLEALAPHRLRVEVLLNACASASAADLIVFSTSTAAAAAATAAAGSDGRTVPASAAPALSLGSHPHAAIIDLKTR